MKAKHFRWLQLLTGIHYIHSVYHGYGWKPVWTKWAWFEVRGWQKTRWIEIPESGRKYKEYFNLTVTGKY